MKKNQDLNQPDELLVKYFTGMADNAEREQALAWIRNSKENNAYFDELRKVYEASKLAQPVNPFQTDASFEKVKARHYKNLALQLQSKDRENSRIFWLELFKYAALIIFLVSLGVVGYRYTKNKPVNDAAGIWNTIEAPYGSRARLTLADGTKVWLNAGSQLRYPSKFAQQHRKVFLTGEAFFDVSKHATKQFIVSTSHLDIKVLGTTFNVKAYSDENTIQTTLVEGSVIIEERNTSGLKKNITALKPSETAIYHIKDNNPAATLKSREKLEQENHPKQNLEVISRINPVVYVSWKDNKWLINGEPLSSLAVKLERRYNVSITISSRELQDYRFSGIIKDETLDQVLNVIKLSAPISYKIENNVVELFENRPLKNSYDELLIKDKK